VRSLRLSPCESLSRLSHLWGIPLAFPNDLTRLLNPLDVAYHLAVLFQFGKRRIGFERAYANRIARKLRDLKRLTDPAPQAARFADRIISGERDRHHVPIDLRVCDGASQVARKIVACLALAARSEHCRVKLDRFDLRHCD